MIHELGIEAIGRRNLEYRATFIKRLEQMGREVSLDADSRSSIIRLAVSEGEYEELVERRIQTSKQSGMVRLSPHFYNNESDIDKFVSCLRPV